MQLRLVILINWNLECLYIISSFSIDKPIIQHISSDMVRCKELICEYIKFGKIEGIKIT